MHHPDLPLVSQQKASRNEVQNIYLKRHQRRSLLIIGQDYHLKAEYSQDLGQIG